MIDQPSVPDCNAAPAASDPGAWLHAVSSGLAKSGLNARVAPTQAGLELSAALQRPGRRETELIIDQDGYAELRWWSGPGSTPAQVITAVIRAITAVTAVPPASGSIGTAATDYL
jgi:hypothetical protein